MKLEPECLRIINHVKIWSRLHEKAVTLPMTAFHVLFNDRMVQQTVFGDALKVTVNFSNVDVRVGQQLIQARSAIIDDGSQQLTYSVKEVQVRQPTGKKGG